MYFQRAILYMCANVYLSISKKMDQIWLKIVDWFRNWLFFVVIGSILVLFIRRSWVNDGQGYFRLVMSSEKMCVFFGENNKKKYRKLEKKVQTIGSTCVFYLFFVCYASFSSSIFFLLSYERWNMLIRLFIIHYWSRILDWTTGMLHIKLKLLFVWVVRKANKNETLFTFARDLTIAQAVVQRGREIKKKTDVNARHCELIMVSISNQWHISMRRTLRENQIQHITSK